MSEEEGKYELTIAEPAKMMRLATDVAGVCEKIVQSTAVNIKGKRYVKVEGWQSIATAHGCVAGSRDVERIDRGVRAIGEIRRIDNGIVIATAEGYVGDDEKAWADRDEYAKRAMAQTRAISRACRSAFAHVVVLIDAELSTTPAEEVPYGGFNDAKPTAPQTFKEVKRVAKAADEHRKDPSNTELQNQRVAQSVQGGEEWKNVVCTYGKTDGKIRGKKLGQIHHMSDIMDSLYAKFVDPQEIKVLKESDGPLRQGLIDWNTWRLEQQQKQQEFAARKQKEVNDSWDESDTIPMDYPESNQPY